MPVQVEAGLVRLPQPLQHRRSLGQKGHCHVVRACGHVQPRLEMCVDLLVVLVLRWLDRELALHLAIEQELQLMLAVHALDLFVAITLKADLHVIVTLTRKHLRNEHPATSTKRQTRHMILLRDVGPDSNSGDLRLVRAPNRLTRDLLRCCDVAIQQRRRQIADSDVVKAMADLVRRKSRLGIKLNPQQMTHGILILHPREATQGRRMAWIWCLLIQIGHEPAYHLLIIYFNRPLFANRRHLAGRELLDHRFPNFRMPDDVLAKNGFEINVPLLCLTIMAIDAVRFKNSAKVLCGGSGRYH